MGYTVTMFNMIAVWLKKLLKTHLTMRGDRNSLKSGREDNCSRKFAQNVPFIVITIKKNFATLCQKNIILVF